MNDEQLLRYSRHILLPEIGIEGQEAIVAARALIVGVGGLGSPASMYLAAAGVGTLVLADNDEVDLTNLQRQIVHRTDRIGYLKTESARETLKEINPLIAVETKSIRLEGATLEEEIAKADVVLDCTDNFMTRHAINRSCVRYRKPLVSGAAIRFEGQVAVFDLREPGQACYHCLFPDGEDVGEMRCAVMGVFAPLTGMVGSVQAAEALKLLMGCSTTMNGRLLLLEALSMQWRSITFSQDPGCAVCALSSQGNGGNAS